MIFLELLLIRFNFKQHYAYKKLKEICYKINSEQEGEQICKHKMCTRQNLKTNQEIREVSASLLAKLQEQVQLQELKL